MNSRLKSIEINHLLDDLENVDDKRLILGSLDNISNFYPKFRGRVNNLKRIVNQPDFKKYLEEFRIDAKIEVLNTMKSEKGYSKYLNFSASKKFSNRNEFIENWRKYIYSYIASNDQEPIPVDKEYKSSFNLMLKNMISLMKETNVKLEYHKDEYFHITNPSMKKPIIAINGDDFTLNYKEYFTFKSNKREDVLKFVESIPEFMYTMMKTGVIFSIKFYHGYELMTHKDGFIFYHVKPNISKQFRKYITNFFGQKGIELSRKKHDFETGIDIGRNSFSNIIAVVVSAIIYDGFIKEGLSEDQIKNCVLYNIPGILIKVKKLSFQDIIRYLNDKKLSKLLK